MDTQNNNLSGRPQLKKVKRPINRMPQTPPLQSQSFATSSPQNQQSGQSVKNNPFVQQSTAQNQPDVGDEAFNLDAYLDEETLPAKTDSTLQNQNPRFLQDDDFAEEYGQLAATELPPYLTKKVLILIGVVLFFIGIITAKVFFSESKVVRNGLQGVVVNPEVPKGRARCGVAERTQGCVLYVMNPQRQDLNARDFYDLAAQMTGRQRFVIETGNMRYANTKIRPGEIVQLNIPPV